MGMQIVQQGNPALGGRNTEWICKRFCIEVLVYGKLHIRGTNLAAGKEIGNVSIYRGLFDGD